MSFLSIQQYWKYGDIENMLWKGYLARPSANITFNKSSEYCFKVLFIYLFRKVLGINKTWMSQKVAILIIFFTFFQLLPPEPSFCNNNRRQKSLTKLNWNFQILVCAKKIAWWQKKIHFALNFAVVICPRNEWRKKTIPHLLHLFFRKSKHEKKEKKNKWKNIYKPNKLTA